MSDMIFGILTITGGIFWILVFTYAVGVIAERLGDK